jgi:hypothetical protein
MIRLKNIRFLVSSVLALGRCRPLVGEAEQAVASDLDLDVIKDVEQRHRIHPQCISSMNSSGPAQTTCRLPITAR